MNGVPADGLPLAGVRPPRALTMTRFTSGCTPGCTGLYAAPALEDTEQVGRE